MSQLTTITTIQDRIIRLPHKVPQNAMSTIPVLFDRLNFRFLHSRAHIGVSRRTRARKHHQETSIFSRTNKTKPKNFPIASMPSLADLKFPNLHRSPLFAFDQIRTFATIDQCVTNEADYDSILHEREFEMHRHHRSPLSKIVKYAKDAVHEGHNGPKSAHDLKILDLASCPIDPPVTIAKEVPRVSLHALTPSRNMLKVVSDKVLEENVANVMTQYSDMVDLSQFDTNSFDLVISCYGLQNSSDPEKLISEIHRVLKPGGRMIVAIWEHLGTEPVVDKILEKVAPTKNMGIRKSELTKPHMLEKMIEDSGLKVLDMNHGEYPLYLSSADGLHGSAFDVVSLPIKEALVELMHSGERPYAFEDARTEFDDIVSQGHLVTTDAQGRLVVEDNRYKIIVARRQYEDNDRHRDIEKVKSSTRVSSKLGIAKPDYDVVKKMISDFNNLLVDTLHLAPNSPWKHLVDSVKRDIAVSGYNGSKKVNVLDLASCPNQATKMLAENLPNVNIYSTNLSSEEVTEMKDFAAANQFHNITPSEISEKQLKDFEDSSIDIITCAFGLTKFSDPEHILKEVHRVLRPGGSFIATTWDSIALERIGDAILSGVLFEKDPHIITPISNLSSYSEPRKLERLVESAGNLSVLKVDHFEFPTYLGKGETSPSSETSDFNDAIIPIRHLLKTLEETGVNPKAFDDARRVYQKMLDENQLMSRDDNGKVKTVRNRYKFLVARRKFEDADGVLDWTTFEKK